MRYMAMILLLGCGGDDSGNAVTCDTSTSVVQQSCTVDATDATMLPGLNEIAAQNCGPCVLNTDGTTATCATSELIGMERGVIVLVGNGGTCEWRACL